MVNANSRNNSSKDKPKGGLDSNTFKDRELYITLASLAGCTVRVNVTFKKDRQSTFQRQKTLQLMGEDGIPINSPSIVRPDNQLMELDEMAAL